MKPWERSLFRIQSELAVLRQRYALHGPWWVITRIFKRISYLLLWCLLLPVILVGHLVGYRRVMVYADRIGHLATEIDGFLKEKTLGCLPQRNYFIPDLPGRTSNPCLLHDYWQKLIPVVSNPLVVLLLDIMTSRWLMRHDVSRFVLTKGGTSALYKLYAEWHPRPPLLELSPAHRARGRDVLYNLGMSRDAWFVCLHSREAGYSPADEMHMDFRNADPANLLLTIEEIRARGGWCVRVGDASGKPMPAMAGVIDYPRSGTKSDCMDIFLGAECRLFIGTNSGLHFVTNIFGRPVALANSVPHAVIAPCPGDLSIPKLMTLQDGTLLPFKEIFSSEAANYQHSTAFKRDKLLLIENTAEEIRDLVTEALDRLDGCWQPDAMDDGLQKNYMANVKPGHFSYGTAGRIGAAFLRKHRNLLN